MENNWVTENNEPIESLDDKMIVEPVSFSNLSKFNKNEKKRNDNRGRKKRLLILEEEKRLNTLYGLFKQTKKFAIFKFPPKWAISGTRTESCDVLNERLKNEFNAMIKEMEDEKKKLSEIEKTKETCRARKFKKI
jgi:hypothetical protein